MSANDYGQIYLEGSHSKCLSITPTGRDTMPPIQITAHVSGASVSLWLTSNEARAVITQLQSVIGKVDDVYSVS